MRNKKMFAILGILLVGIVLMCTSCAKEKSGKMGSELLPVEGNPLIDFRILLNIGSVNDPAGKEGLCDLALSMLASGGTKTLTFKEIQQRFYPMAAGVGLSVEKEMSVFMATIHIENLEKFYAVFKEMLLDPGFREEDFTRLKTNQLNFLEKTLVGNMDEQFGKEILNLMMYEGHPYGHHDSGTVDSVRSLTLDDVKAFYQDHIKQGNFTIGLAGGYPSDFPAKVAADFSVLPEGFTPKLELQEQRMPEGLEFVIADKQTPATNISMGFPHTINKSSDDFFALWIATSHFGEHRQSLSLLYQKIREERGQNYGDYAYADHFIQGRRKFPATNFCRQQQYFSIWIRALANSNRHFVIRQALRELKKLVEEGIPKERFDLVKKYLLNYTKLYAQTLGERLGWQMDSHYYGYNDFLAEVQKRLPKITHEDVNRAIKTYLNSDKIYIAVITQDAEGLKNDLIANTPSPISYANPNMPQAVLDEDLVIQTFPLDVNPEKVRIAKASDFFQKTGIPKSK